MPRSGEGIVILNTLLRLAIAIGCAAIVWLEANGF